MDKVETLSVIQIAWTTEPSGYRPQGAAPTTGFIRHVYTSDYSYLVPSAATALRSVNINLHPHIVYVCRDSGIRGHLVVEVA